MTQFTFMLPVPVYPGFAASLLVSHPVHSTLSCLNYDCHGELHSEFTIVGMCLTLVVSHLFASILAKAPNPQELPVEQIDV